MAVRGRAFRISTGAALLSLALVGTAAPQAEDVEPFKLADTQLEPVKWSDLPGWAADDHRGICGVPGQLPPVPGSAVRPRDIRPVYVALVEVCRRAAGLRPSKAAQARAFFENNFRPVRINRLGETEGFLTGYYEPIVDGSRFPSPEFHIPLYRRLPDLVAAGHNQVPITFPTRA